MSTSLKPLCKSYLEKCRKGSSTANSEYIMAQKQSDVIGKGMKYCVKGMIRLEEMAYYDTVTSYIQNDGSSSSSGILPICYSYRCCQVTVIAHA